MPDPFAFLPMAIDFEAEGLLEGLDGPARKARLELLEKLEDDGVPLDELRIATKENRLPLVPVERVLGGGGRRYSAEEISELTGLDQEFLERVWRGLGMALAAPDEKVYTEADLEAARRAKAFQDAGLPEEGILEISRTAARAMANVAATIASVFSEAYLRAGDDEESLALRYAEASRELTPMLGPVLEHILNVQQRSLIRQAAVDSSTLEAGTDARRPGDELLLRRPRGVHEPGRERGARRAGRRGRAARARWRSRWPSRPCG